MIENLQAFKKDLQKGGQTVLFLGAGVNYSPGKHMLWDDLLTYLVKHATIQLNAPREDMAIIKHSLEHFPNLENATQSDLILKIQAFREFPVEVRASIVKHLLGNSFIPMIQTFLYEQCSDSDLHKACQQYANNSHDTNTPFFSLLSVAEIILRNNRITNVVTYNYDTFLTTAIKYLKDFIPHDRGTDFVPCDIYGKISESAFFRNTLPIYHIHGMINSPRRFTPNNNNQIVLSLEEYYQSAKDVYSWQTAVQQEFLTQYTCAFIGTSLSDITMQRMLHHADISHNSNHVYYLTAHISQKKEHVVLQHLKNAYHTLNGLRVICDPEGYNHLYNELKKS